jgi:hypothetical protein
MPTIDQLGSAPAASDTDEFPASQNGVTRKVSRRQIIAGLQPQIALGAGTLLGRSTPGTGNAEQIAVGSNLTLAGGVLSAQATPYKVAALPAGTVPSGTDLVPLGQGGANTAIPFAQFAAGIAGVPNIDGSSLTVTPTGASTAVKLADFAAAALPRAGGQVTGPLLLAADPTVPAQAATRNYVDTQTATRLPTAGGTLTGALTLAADPVQPLQPATKQYADARMNRSGDTMTGPLIVGGTDRSYGTVTIAPVQRDRLVSGATSQTTSYVLTTASAGAGTLSNLVRSTDVVGAPNFSVWSGYDRVDYKGTGGTGAHVASYAQAIRDAYGAGGPSANPAILAASHESRDTTAQPSAATGPQLCVAMQLFANGADSGGGVQGLRQIQSLTASKHDPNGAHVEVGTGSGYYAATGDSFRQVISVAAPFSVAALSTVAATQLAGANAIWLGDGQKVAFDTAGAHTLSFDAGRGALVTPSALMIGPSDFADVTVNATAPNVVHVNKIGTAENDVSVLSTYHLVNHTGVGPNINQYGIVHNAQLASTPPNGYTGMFSGISVNAGGGNTGDNGHEAGYRQALRQSVPRGSTTIASAAPAGSTSVQVADVRNFHLAYPASNNGGSVPVSAATPLPVLINGNAYTAVGCNPANPQGAAPVPGTLTLAGPLAGTDGAVNNAVEAQVIGSPIWGDVVEVKSFTGHKSSVDGYLIGCEMDMAGNDADDGNCRYFLGMFASMLNQSPNPTPFEFSNFLQLSLPSGTSVKQAITLYGDGAFSQSAIDLRQATQGASANAIWMRDGHRVALDTAGKWQVFFDAGTQRVVISFAGTRMLSLDQAGNLRVAGSITSNAAP